MATKRVADNIVGITARGDAKGRFAIFEENGERYIKCAQGHSVRNVNDDIALRKITLADRWPVICAHGTRQSNVHSIVENGLSAGGPPTAVENFGDEDADENTSTLSHTRQEQDGSFQDCATTLR